MKKVIILGKGKLAVKIAHWFLITNLYKLIQIVPVIPEPIWTDSLIKWCKQHKISYIPSGDYNDVLGGRNNLDWDIDLAISVYYNKILPQWFIDRFDKIINIHNAPLPKYRGVRPINWALKNKENYHGVTIHEITKKIDSGPILGQVKYPIYPKFDEVIDVYNVSLEYAWILFQQIMPIMNNIKPIPQDNSKATYHSLKQNKYLGKRNNFTKRESE